MSDHTEKTTHWLSLFDDSTLELKDSFELDPTEQAISCTTCIFERMPDKECIVVGTAYMVADEVEAAKGRLLIFEVTEEKKVRLVTEKESKAAVFTLAPLNGKLVAGVGSKVSEVYYLMCTNSSVVSCLCVKCAYG
jgi:DNA damage-binding protein 1